MLDRFFLLLLLSGSAFAQFTNVTGTVIDPNGLPYANATISSMLILPGGASPTLNGFPYIQPLQPSALDLSGKFLLRLADNTQLSPAGTKWNFTVCSAGGTVFPALGKGPVCFSLTSPITISGTAQDISVQLNAVALALTVLTSATSPPTAFGILVTSRGLKCDGVTDDTTAFTTLVSSFGTNPNKLIFPPGPHCVLGTASVPRTLLLDLSGGGTIQCVNGSTLTILSGNTLWPMWQVFFNCDTNQAGNGTIDFTGGYAVENVHPEWWGGYPENSGSTNLIPWQDAIYAAMGNQNRTNGSGNFKYNRPLAILGPYHINGELKCYHCNGFKFVGTTRLGSGLVQDATNARIIDGQNISYGAFLDMSFSTGASQTTPLVDLDNDHTHGADLSPQFIDAERVNLGGNGTTDTGFLIAKHGGDAQGSNIYCWDCAANGFTGAAWQAGGNNTGRNTGRFYAQNAIDIGWYGGDIQGSPLYGFATYGASSVFTHDVTFENGFTAQTGFDQYCEAPVGFIAGCLMEDARSESRRLIAGGNVYAVNSYTVNQASFPTPGNSMGLGTILTGSLVGGDGQYYKVTVNGIFGGVGTPTTPESATAGAATSITNGSASYTVNAFTGFLASILSGTGTGEYCLVTSNTTTQINCTGGWLTKYAKLTIVNPDNTSKYVVEMNWGTQTTSGTATIAALNEDGIEGSVGAGANNLTMINVDVPGDQISVGQYATLRNVTVTRPDWIKGTNFFASSFVATNYDGVYLDPQVAFASQTYSQTWSFPELGGTQYKNNLQLNIGTKGLVFSRGNPISGAATDSWMDVDSLGLPPHTFAEISALLNVRNGMFGYCSDCKNVLDDAVSFDSALAAGGHGTNYLRENGAFRVH